MLSNVIKQGLFRIRHSVRAYNTHKRSLTTQLPLGADSTVLVPVKCRKLLKISGEDASDFLQGLITNDMRHLSIDNPGTNVMYTMMLNNKGRVMYDCLIYRWLKDSFLIECDRGIFPQLQKHLTIYKLKRNVQFENMTPLSVWALLSPKTVNVKEVEYDPNSKINVVKDPRISELGYRVITSFEKPQEILDVVGKDIMLKDDEDVYKYVRYKAGVAEGSEDLTPGVCFPLEINCDYLHGVSFHKGCYIGQELTARVHHTGVVRKRLMPLKFPDVINEHIESSEPILSSKNTNIGKLFGYIHDLGIGLVRIKEVTESNHVNIKALKAEAIKPTWWPVEATKEKPKTGVDIATES